MACTTSQKQTSPIEDNCYEFYQGQLSEQSYIWGFGESGLRVVALDLARSDLAKQISVRVTSRAQTSETAESLEFQAVSQSLVDRQLDGVQTVRSCKKDGRYQAVIRISKQKLLASIKASLVEIYKNAEELLKTEPSEASRQQELEFYVKLKEFRDQNVDFYKDSLKICVALGNCQSFNALGIESKLLKYTPAKQFYFVFTNELAARLAPQIRRIVKQEGISELNENTSAELRISCERNDFEPSSQIREKLVKLICWLEAVDADVIVFRYELSATGYGLSYQDAFRSASSLLRLE